VLLLWGGDAREEKAGGKEEERDIINIDFALIWVVK
jgi:hypothetical protein